VISEKQGLGIS